MTALPLLALLNSATDVSVHGVLDNAYFVRVIKFSFYQALLSAALSVGIAIPVARALSKEQRFVGRSLIVNLYSLSLVIPTIVAIFGIVAVYGRTGWINDLIGLVGIKPFSIYGLAGILLAHVFFNMPLASRVLLQSLDNIPHEQWRLATQLRMNGLAQFKYLEWSAMRQQIVGIFMLIFTLCFTSFTIVMTLGGGPSATTVEVAIYQALRYDFDISAAVSLALVQLVLCAAILVLGAMIKQSTPTGFSYRVPSDTYRAPDNQRWINFVIIACATLFVLLPLLGLLISAINPSTIKTLLHDNTLRACINTVLIACCAALLALSMGIGILLSTRHLRIRRGKTRMGNGIQLLGNIILVMPPVVLGTGLFLLLRDFADVFSLALILATIINSLMALPFVLRILDGPLMQAAEHNDKLIQSLGITGWSRWRLLDWPLIRKPIGFALAVSATMAAGDLSAIALFGSERAMTLPLLLFQRMGSYRLYEAAVTAAILLLVCLALFVFFQKLVGGQKHADA